MSAQVLHLDDYRAPAPGPGELMGYRAVCAELDRVLEEVLSEPVDFHLDEDTGELDTLPPCAPLDGTFQPVPARRRVWR